MKSKVRIGLLGGVALIVVFLCVLVLNYKVDNTYSTDAGIVGIQEYVDEYDNPTKVSFVLENINLLTHKNMNENKYKVYSDDVTLTFANSQTNEDIIAENNIVTLTSEGVTVSANAISKGSKYDIIVEPVETKYGFASDYKKAILTIDYTDKLNAYVKEVIDKDNNSVEIDDKAILLFTDENNKVKLRANEELDLEYTFSLTELNDEQLSQASFKVYDKNNYLPIETNGWLYAKAKYKTNGYSKIAVLHITNIDKLPPFINDDVSVTLNDDNESATVSYSFDDATATLEYGKSGVKEYAFSEFPRITDDKYKPTNGETSASNVVTENGTYYIHVRDYAGNTAVKPVEVSIIPAPPEEYVIVILESPNPDLTGMLFTSLRKMTNKFAELGLTDDDHVVAQVLKNIKNQDTVINDVNLTIDLNGYTISSKNSTPIFEVTDGSRLKLMEYKYTISDFIEEEYWNNVPYSQFTNGEGNGSVINTVTDAIDVDEGGTLVVGEDNSPDLLHIEYPNHSAPYIEGAAQGIFNHGTMNYYDGVIVGEIAVNGLIQDTPYLYDPSAVENDSLQKHYMTLEMVTNVEALIGKTRFTYLEDAIAYANDRVGDSNTQIEIDIVAELDKPAAVGVDNTKNIILDLNGHTFSNHVNDIVLNNYGRVIIKDTGGDGLITNPNNITIKNYKDAYLEVAGGTIDNTYRSSVTIFNDNGAELVVSGGTINHSSSNNYAVNNNGGKFTINDGIVNSTVYSKDIISNTESAEEIDIDLSTMVTSGTYPFKYQDGKMVSTNYGERYNSSRGYYTLDLTGYESGETFTIKTNVTVPYAYRNYAWAYGTVTEDTTPPALDDSMYIFKETSGCENKDYTLSQYRELKGGKIYYLQFGYVIRGTSSGSSYRLEINSAKLIRKRTYIGEIHVDGGTINSNVSNNSYYNSATITDGTITGSFGNANGGVNMTGGYILGTATHGSSSILDFNISGGYIEKLSSETVAYNTRHVNISGGEIHDLTHGGGVEGGQVIITGGKFSGTIENNGYMEVSNALVTGQFKQAAFMDLTINSTVFEKTPTNNETVYSFNIKNDKNLVDNNTKTIFNDCTFKLNAQTSGSGSPNYNGIQIESSGEVILNNTNMLLKVNDSYTGDRGGSYYTSIIGIYNNAVNTNLYLINSNISAISDDPTHLFSYAIYNKYKGTTTIGVKDGDYKNDTCLITSSYLGIYNDSGLIKFYDGVIKGRDKAVVSTINSIEDNYYLHHYTSNGYDVFDLSTTGADNVLNVEKNKYYTTIQEAIADSSSGNNLKVVADELFETKITVDSSKEATVDFNGKNIYIGGIINDGNITLKDSNEPEEAYNIRMGNVINNNQFTYSSGRYKQEVSGKSAITNNGVMNVENSKFTTNTQMTNSETYIIDNDSLFTNYNTLNIKNGSVLAVNSNEFLVTNHYTGTVNMSGGHLVLERWNGYTTQGTYGIYNSGIVNVTGGTSTRTVGYSIYNTMEYIGPKIKSVDGDEYNVKVSQSSGYLTSNVHDIYIPIDLTEKTGTWHVDVYRVKTNGGTAVAITNTPDRPSSYSSYPEGNGRLLSQLTTPGGYMTYIHLRNEYRNVYNIRVYNDEEEIELFKNGTVNISGGELTGVLNYNAKLNISGGTIDGGLPANGNSNYTASVTSGGYSDVTLSGGILDGKGNAGISMATGSYLKTTGGTIKNAGTGISLGGGSSADIDDITINDSNTGIDLGGGVVNMNGGNINLIRETGGLNGVIVGASGTFNMNGGTIKVEATATNTSGCNGVASSGYDSYTYNININDGTIISKGVNKNNGYYGIFGTGNSTTNVQLGSNDTNVSITNPSISGSSYGIYKKNGDFKFYDGIIKGDTTFYGGVTDRPESYELFYGTEDELKTVILKKVELIQNEDTGAIYGTLQSAFNACEVNVACNLKVLYPFTIKGVNRVDEGKIINLNVNEKTISALADNYIINQGSLKITNGTLEITSGSVYESIITNYGTLEIGDGAIIDGHNFTKVRLIDNYYYGVVNMTGGKVTGSGSVEKEYGSGIYNHGGTLNLTGGEIVDNSGGGNHSMIENSIRFNGEVKTLATGYSIPRTYYDYVYAPKNSSGGVAGYYIPIDLTNVSGTVTLEVSTYGTIVNPSNSEHTFIKVEETPIFTNVRSNPDYNVANNPDPHLMVKKLEGGKIYYLMVSTTQYGRLNALRYYNDDVEYNFFAGTTNLGGTDLISNADNYAFHSAGGNVNYTAGNIKSTTAYTGTGLLVDGGTILTVSNVSITNKKVGIYARDYLSRVKVRNYTYTNSSIPANSIGIQMQGGTLDVDGFTMNVTGCGNPTYGIYMDNRTNANIKNANISITGANNGFYGIYMGDNNNVVLSDSTINVKTTSNSGENIYGAYMYGSLNTTYNTFTVKNSTIKAEGVDSNRSIYGIAGYYSYNPSSTSESVYVNDIIIGDLYDSVDTENTLIYGTNSGIAKRYGHVKYYDGIIKGAHALTYAGISDYPLGYLPTLKTSGTEEYYILEQRKLVENTTNGTQYYSLQEAIDSCADNTACNLKLLESNFLKGQPIVGKNKIINLDFNGKTLHSTKDNYITNDGKLTMSNGTYDAVGSGFTRYGSSLLTRQALIYNNGELNISTGLNIYTNNYSNSVCIQNNWSGTLNVNDGSLTAGMGAYAISNRGGTINVNGGTITGYTYTIESSASLKQKHYVYEGYKVDYVPASGGIYADRKNYKYYIPIDLTEYSGNVTIRPIFDNSIYYYSDTNCYYNYIALTESTDEPEWTVLNDQSVTSKDYNVQGGKVYYLHIQNTWDFALFDIAIIQGENEEHMQSRSKININGGTLIDGSWVIYGGKTDVNFRGGTIESTTSKREYAIRLSSDSNLYVSAQAKVVNRGLADLTASYCRIDGLDLEYVQGMKVYKSNCDIYNMNIHYASEEAVPKVVQPLIIDSGDVNIYNLTIDMDVNSASAATGIVSSGNVNIYDANISVKNSGNGNTIGVSHTYNNLYVEKIEATATGGNKSYGLSVGGGVATLGSHDGTVPSKVTPHFTGDLNGAYISYGTFNFYDGKLTATNGIPIVGNVADIPQDYRIIGEDNSYVLGLASSIEDTFELNGVYYQSLDMAVKVLSNSSNKTGTINLWNNVIIGSGVTIPSGTNLTLALQGHSIDFENVEVGITNNGTLTIIDGNQDEIDVDTNSYITNNTGTVIQNNGSLTIGVSGNKNPNSPTIRGNIAVSGTSPTINSGTVTSTSSGVGHPRGMFNLIQPSYSYKYSDLQINNLPMNTVLAEKPGIRSVDDLTVWTNQNINVGMTSHNLGVLNVFTNKDESCKKDVKYSVEVYKNGVLDEFNSFDHVVQIYCLDNEIVPVDKDYFDNVPKQFKEFYITRVVLNDKDITTIPDNVDNNSVFKLYYGQNKGEEIEIINPKTGVMSFKHIFIGALIAFIILGVLSYIYRLHLRKNGSNV